MRHLIVPNENPIVSIIIPTYNRADIIIDTLSSVQNQTYQNWECIVVDDKSTDNSNKIFEKFSAEDNRFIFLKRDREPKGSQTCRNIGLEKSNGDFVIFLDSDDLLTPNCVERRIAFMGQNPGNDLYCFPTAIFNETPFDNDKLWNYLNKPKGDLERFFMQDMPWCVYGSFWSKNFLNELGGWDENLVCWQDWDIHVRALLKKEIKYIKAEDKLENIDSFYRMNSNYASINNKEYDVIHIKNRMYLFNKLLPHLKELDGGLRLEFARLSFRLSKQLVTHIGFPEAKNYLIVTLKEAQFSKLFIFLWAGYLYNLCFQNENKGFNRIYNLAYRIYKSKNLLVYNSTHLKAVYNQ